jgi:hypothetical protein
VPIWGAEEGGQLVGTNDGAEHRFTSFLDRLPSRRHRQRFGRARRRSFERPFKYKKEEPLKALIYINRDGQFLSENGQFVVVNGQKAVANLAE